MAVLRIINFGGLVPSANPRALPPNAATTATNLHPNTTEFRPTLGATTHAAALGTSNPPTLYRMERDASGDLNTNPATNWLSYSELRSHARWPSAADLTERTTLSTRDGSVAPRVITATGVDRLLGVPAPTAAPTVTLNPGDYYTREERESDVKGLRAAILKAIRAALDRAKVGATYTNNLIEGYVENGTEVQTVLPLNGPSPRRSRVYEYTAEDGTIVDAYTAAPETDVAWVRMTKKGVWYQATVSDPVWMGGIGTWHYKLDYHAYGIGYKLDSEAGLATALDAIEYIDTDQAEDMAEVIAGMFDQSSKDAQAVIVPLREAVAKLEYTIDHRPPGSATAGEFTAAQDDLLDALAVNIWKAIKAAARVDRMGVGA